ncbi:bifunctional aspartate transaminase/aspartate 4-decarboxylase [uncultured Shewanella sp.]|uniref:bifunctional aspartate transaminase/aspartate 4-decarboxylase n=1 Tax=uncultured Shewanella sp. TaxID=173975 RepID=UPI002634C4C2|nr:bifunctional aspartate transaminase/aspartate 4-decarboxylase [uncultured Shewanella sp.]
MSNKDYAQWAKLSPFELKDKLIEIACNNEHRLLLDAGRGNPNFLATLPRRAFLRLGDFALEEAERSYTYINHGFGGIPDIKGIVARFDTFAQKYKDTEGVQFIQSAISYVKDQLGLSRHEFLHEMVNAFLGCNYPVPPRMLTHSESVVKNYIQQEMYGHLPSNDSFDLFATEGGTAAMTYSFQTLFKNGLLKQGDKIALTTPIFTPYLEIPLLAEYALNIVEVRLDEETWQLNDNEIAKLNDPDIKLFCIVNPSNPASYKFSNLVLDKLTKLITTKRPDLFIITDDVYGTFADNFVSLFARCPYNTICVYSFSKYFGATGWRLGVIAVQEKNIFDDTLKLHNKKTKTLLNTRYKTLSPQPEKLKFIDRIVADSRAVALNHTAGLSLPQQVQMVFFSLACLMDTENYYKQSAKRIIRDRFHTLYKSMGISIENDANRVDYYTLLDLDVLGKHVYGEQFVQWFKTSDYGPEFLFKLADETGVVLLPGKGFDVVHGSVRVSLANLTHNEYKAIGKLTKAVVDEYYAQFLNSKKQS